MALMISCQQGRIIRLGDLSRLAVSTGQHILIVQLHRRKGAELSAAGGHICPIISGKVAAVDQQDLISRRIQTALQIAFPHQHGRGYVTAVIIAVKLPVFAHPPTLCPVDAVILLGCRRHRRQVFVVHGYFALPERLCLRFFGFFFFLICFFLIFFCFTFIFFPAGNDDLRCMAVSLFFLRRGCVPLSRAAKIAAAHANTKTQKKA